jgi:hypothetical protein
MVALNQPYNPDEHDSWQEGFELIENEGPHVGQLVANKEEPTKDGSGRLIVCEFEIIDGDYTGRKLWENLLIESDNPDKQRGVKAAQRKLRDICTAVGHSGLLNDVDELMFRPMLFRVGIEPAKGQYRAKNTIDGFYPIEGAQPPAGKPAVQAAAPAPAKAAQTRPAPAPAAQRGAPAAAPSGPVRPWATRKAS